MTLIVAGAGLTAFYSHKRGYINLTARTLPILLGAAYLFFGAAVASIDQLITTSITPFVVASIAVAVGFLVKPMLACMCYLAMYGVFLVLISFTQSNPEVILSLRVNAITISGVGFFISYLLWQNTVTNLHYQARLEANARELAENNRIKDELFAVVSHDIRDPLAVLVSLTELLAEEKDQLSPETAEIIGIVQERIHHTYGLVESLLEWFRARIHNLDLSSIQPLLLAESISRALESCRVRAESKAVTLSVDVPPDLMVAANGDVLEVILRNLLVNAIKFTPSGGDVQLEASSAGAFALVAIKDSGIGIAPNRLKLLFSERSRYVASPGTAGEKGTGFGLMICKEFVQKAGGEIWVISTLGEGSVFYFTLPLY